MFRSLVTIAVSTAGVSALTALPPVVDETGNVALFEKTGDSQLDKKVEDLFKSYHEHHAAVFDVKGYMSFLQDFKTHLANYKTSAHYTGYKSIPGQPICDVAEIPDNLRRALAAKSTSPFPGGILARILGFDLGQHVMKLAEKAQGPAAASGSLPAILAAQALVVGAGMVQGVIANAVNTIPPLIPNLKPISCLPMITGLNCFGAVLYPITAADFVIADITDSMMDGYIAGFPQNYALKVGKTDDVKYKLCFLAYMSMMCSSIFHRCIAPADTCDDPLGPGCQVGRMPMCFPLCISTLVACPGFWIDDIMGPCQSIAAPMACSLAIYWNIWRLPPQYTSFEDAHPTALDCPSSDPLLGSGGDDSSAFKTGDISSPFTAASAAGALGSLSGSGAVRVPNA